MSDPAEDVYLNISAIDIDCRFPTPKAPTRSVRTFRGSVRNDGSYKKEATLLFTQFEGHQRIGEGSFGVVYSVNCTKSGESSAVKVMSLGCLHNWKNSVEKVILHKELNGHKNIVTLYNVWIEQETLYVQLELCQQSLREFIARNPRMPEVHIWDVLADIAQALRHVHSSGMVHLDVKPDNILIGYDGRYKLADFDLLSRYPVENKKLLSSLGDEKYRASETLYSVYEPKCDIFSLGITLLEMAGDFRLPINGPSWHSLRKNGFPLTQLQQAHRSQDLLAIIQKMMNKEMVERPSAWQVLQNKHVRKHVAARNKKLGGVRTTVKKLIQSNKHTLERNLKRFKAARETPDPASSKMIRAASFPYSEQSENTEQPKLKAARRLNFDCVDED